MTRQAYSPAEVAEMIGRSEWTVRKHLREGWIAGTVHRGKWFVPASEVARLTGNGVGGGAGNLATPNSTKESAA